jgi:hypothetical protein
VSRYCQKYQNFRLTVVQVYGYYISKLTVEQIKDKPGGAVIVRRKKEKTFWLKSDTLKESEWREKVRVEVHLFYIFSLVCQLVRHYDAPSFGITYIMAFKYHLM